MAPTELPWDSDNKKDRVPETNELLRSFKPKAYVFCNLMRKLIF